MMMMNGKPAEEAGRAGEILTGALSTLHQQTDRLFARLMIFQWLAGIAAAVWISPRTWIGASSRVHWHVWAAIFLGGLITSLPVFLTWRRPGTALTRQTIAMAQMIFSALLIHLTGGRIETHFHVFGSLAFLAFYRDWRVLVTATVVVAADHWARGVFWPQSVFGVVTSSGWRWLEHAGWVVFEDVFLLISIRQSLRDMAEVAGRHANLEELNAGIERKVIERTRELTLAHTQLLESEERFRTLSSSAPIGIFLTDGHGRAVYTNPEWHAISGVRAEAGGGEDWRQTVHPEDAARVLAQWQETASQGREYDEEFRFQRAAEDVRWVHARSAVIRAKDGTITGHVGTVEDITERKLAEAELKRAHRELVDTSRLAGMAEIATGVLHNIGNVLNSVNVSATCVAGTLKKSKVGGLAKVAGMLKEHEADLGAYLTQDERGRQIPAYLGQLATQLTGEQARVMEEVEHLQKSVDHIKDIVTMQQNFARVSGVTEEVQVGELVQDTLRMHAVALARHQVQVVTEIDPQVPVILVEKHKVLQILVNLVRNAKQACTETERTDRQMVIRVGSEAGRIKIAVADNGIGIPAENLARIFAHGFTTKRNGHGFGLHSGALAAKEMGGALRVESAGPYRGATFTLELPLRTLD